MIDKDSPVETFKRATAATIRALAGREEVQVSFVGEVAGVIGDLVRLPPPARDLDQAHVAISRGQADAAALRLRHHSPALHLRYLPEDPTVRVVFEALEQARCESLGARAMTGVAANLEAAMAERCRRQGLDRVTKRDQVSLAEVMRLLAREVLTGLPLPASAVTAADVWRPWLDQRLGPDWRGLAGELDDQRRFARTVRQLLKALDLEVGPEPEPESEPERDDEAEDSGQDQPDSAGDPGAGDEDQETARAETKGSAAESGDDDLDDDFETSPEQRDQPFGESPGDELMAPGRPPGRADSPPCNPSDPNLYRVFTTHFDEVKDAIEFCDANELTRLRSQLDNQLRPLQGVIAKLANRLQRRLLAQQTRAWEFDLEEGLLDSARLSRVVVNPMLPLSFKRERETDFRDTVVTLLIDNSGSMRGRPIAIAAICADVLARTLERCGVKVEILGFTTSAWKGGKSREQWVGAGKPAQPGRLNDLRHIIYKSADAPWRRARRNLGLMLREGLLKENIDGEALHWAHQRLLGRFEQRRILMVISDGAPVDDATLSTNAANYLERHLRQMIEWIETHSPVELIAVGIGHDVTRYYRRAVTLVDVEQLGGIMMEKLAELFEEHSRLPQRSRLRRERDRELVREPGTPHLIAVFGWSPVGLFVSQDHQGNHCPLIEIPNPIVRRQHPLQEVGSTVAMHLDMNQHPTLGAIYLAVDRRQFLQCCDRGLDEERHEAQRQSDSLGQELVKAEQRHALLRLTAPEDGTVQQLAVHTLGGVVVAGAAAGHPAQWTVDHPVERPDWVPLTEDGAPFLVPGAAYFLSAILAGGITRTPPVLPGQWVVPVGHAVSSTVLHVTPGTSVKL
ncbi:cobaltochelatase CobT [uncultured Gammaproteobacteria bacterium]